MLLGPLGRFWACCFSFFQVHDYMHDRVKQHICGLDISIRL